MINCCADNNNIYYMKNGIFSFHLHGSFLIINKLLLKHKKMRYLLNSEIVVFYWFRHLIKIRLNNNNENKNKNNVYTILKCRQNSFTINISFSEWEVKIKLKG